MILQILYYPDKRLHTIAQPVLQVNDDVRNLIKSMFETMYKHGGIGLAATQINVHNRIFVMDIGNRPFALINPVILEQSEELYKFREGCLSVGILEVTKRPKSIKVGALDIDGNPCVYHFDDLEAACVQHEIEHLDGKIFFEELSPVKKQRVVKKLAKLIY